MNEPIKFQTIPDEYIAEEDTVSANELFNDIMAGFAEMQAFEEEGKTLRVTEYVDGERLPPADLTAVELKARRVARSEEAKLSRNSFSHAMNGNALSEKTTAKKGIAKQELLVAEPVEAD